MSSQRDVLSPFLVLLSFSVESSNCYHLDKHSLKNIEKFFDTWCKTQFKMFRSSQVSSKHSWFCVIIMTQWKWDWFPRKLHIFKQKKLPVKQVHGRAEIFSCLFPVKFQAAIFTRGEMCQLKQGWQFWTCSIFSVSFLGTATFYFNAFLCLLGNGK